MTFYTLDQQTFLLNSFMICDFYSILVSSMEWSKVQPNLPWVVEASGCVMLDTFVSLIF
ncbi:hypothetical protein Hanom_Chr06g00501091 [Helianthus anomalus]